MTRTAATHRKRRGHPAPRGCHTTGLTLAKTAITYGHETAEKLTVSVSHAGSVYATGKVEVKSGSTVVCTITLNNGTGSCTLTARRLSPAPTTRSRPTRQRRLRPAHLGGQDPEGGGVGRHAERALC